MDSWVDPGDFKEATALSHLDPGAPSAPMDWGPVQGPNGCADVPFDPTFDVQPLGGAKAGAPAALSVDVNLPQSDNPDGIGESDLERATVTLPVGMRVAPGSADGLKACNSGEIGLGSDSEPTCPDGSKIGDVVIDTPLLDEQVKGSVFLAKPFDNPFNSLVALYLVAEAQGVIIKLPGQVTLDQTTGQISTTFDNNPQLPFSRLHVEFKTGPRAPLVMPKTCGPHTTQAEFEGWNGRIVNGESTFVLTENARGQPCPSTFTPGFEAGTSTNSAGTSSPFLLRFTRDDEDQVLRSVTVNLPNGLTGKIANVPLCAENETKAGRCPEQSKVGDVTVGAGAGTNPFFITNGRAYLTGPYKGAPFGMSIVVPAIAGPFDLGTVTVRSALYVDKHDATVRVVSDRLPTVLEGIPLDVRDVRVKVNQPDFFINPTSCAEKTIGAVLESTEGGRANVADRFQAAECRGLGFKPRMGITVGGAGHTARNATSPLTTRLTMPPRDEANIKSVKVTLPTTINARLTVINDACTRAEFEADARNCDHARAGVATAVTPLLRDPLRGNVYFVKNGHPIPDLFIALRGEVDFDLIGRVSIPGGKHLATTFGAVPDVPVRSFALRLVGDRANGSVGAATNLCSRRGRSAKAKLDYVGQNGRVFQVDQALNVKGCGRHKAHRSAHLRRHGRPGGR